MSKELIISKTFDERRVVLLDNEEIIDFLIGRKVAGDDERLQVGNIYKGTVLKVLPGMQSAFVGIGDKKAAFLYVDDAYIPDLSEISKNEEKILEGDSKIYPSSVETIPDELSTLADKLDMRSRPGRSIEKILKEGDEILVQISKEPIANKGPKVTRNITIAGRYVVFMPFIEHLGVSRRIEDEKERKRLSDIMASIKQDGRGVIARTVAEGQGHKVLKADYNMLVKLWKEIKRKSERLKAPAICYRDLTFIQRAIRDIADEDINRVVFDSRADLQEAEKFSSKFVPKLRKKLHFYDDDLPLFEKFGVEMEIERGISNTVFLRSGGLINIDQTEALVSIDVNTGKFVGRNNLEETVLRINLEAVKEIAYQLRLRNCGGIIIIDFIDMKKEKNREQVYKSLIDALKKDRVKINVLKISDLGVLQMTRKRKRDTLNRIMCVPCYYCGGSGMVKSVMTVCYEVVRKLIKLFKNNTDCLGVHVYAHPEVTAQLAESDSNMIETIEEQFGKSIVIRSENSYHIEQYEIMAQGGGS